MRGKYSLNVVRTALALAEVARVDLLLTDVIMPGMSGIELGTKLRETNPGLPILYMSGYTASALEHHGPIGAGETFIQKPFTPESLGSAIRRALDNGGGGGTGPI